MGKEGTVMYRWFNDHGYEAHIAALREEHPGLVSFEQYLRANGWENAEAPPKGWRAYGRLKKRVAVR
jgi:hypothetical protein